MDIDVVYIYMGYYATIKKNKTLPFAIAQMNLEGIMLRAISQTKTNTVWSLLYVESKKKTTKPK